MKMNEYYVQDFTIDDQSFETMYYIDDKFDLLGIWTLI